MALNLSTGFTDNTGTDAIQRFFDTQLLYRAVYALIHPIPTMKKNLAQREGKTMLWRRYEALPLVTAALGEGVNPTPRSKTKNDVAATMAPYGDVIEDTDFLIRTQPEAVQAENVALLGQQMGETFDAFARDRFATATNVVYVDGVSTLTVTKIITSSAIERALRLMGNNKARRFNPMIMASQKIGSGSIMPSYWGLCHEDVYFDLRHVDGFVLPSDYENRGASIKGEMGAHKYGVRFLVSPNGYKLAGATGVTATATDVKNTGGFADIYSLFIVGEQAVGTVDLAGDNGGVIRHGFGTSGVADALNLRQTTGWKKFYADVVLNQSFMSEVQTAASL